MSCFGKDNATRLAECLTALRARPNGPRHVAHLKTLATDAMVANASLGSHAQDKEARTLARTIWLIEDAFNNGVHGSTKQALLLLTAVALRPRLDALLVEPANGPAYYDAGHPIPAARPATWAPAPATGDAYAFHTTTGSLVIGPNNPRSNRQNYPMPLAANDHSQLAWELVRHFNVNGGVGEDGRSGVAQTCATGNENFPSMLAGRIMSWAPFQMTDDSGHFYKNYSRDNLVTFFARMQIIMPGGEFQHLNACPWPNNRCHQAGHSFHAFTDVVPAY